MDIIMIDLMFNLEVLEVEDLQHQLIKHLHSHQIKLLHQEVVMTIPDHQTISQHQVDQLMEVVMHLTQLQVNVQLEDHLEEFQVKVPLTHQQELDHHLIHQHQQVQQLTFQEDQVSAVLPQELADNQQAQPVSEDQQSVEVLLFQELQLDQQVDQFHHQLKMTMLQKAITVLFPAHLMSIIQFILKYLKLHSIVINNNIQVKYCLTYEIV